MISNTVIDMAGQKKKAKVGRRKRQATVVADLPSINVKLSEGNVDSALSTTTSNVIDFVNKPIDATLQLNSSTDMKLSEEFFFDAVSDAVKTTTNKNLLDAVDDIISDSVDATFTLGNNHTSTKESDDSAYEHINVDNEAVSECLPTRNHFLTFPFIAGIALNETSVNCLCATIVQRLMQKTTTTKKSKQQCRKCS